MNSLSEWNAPRKGEIIIIIAGQCLLEGALMLHSAWAIANSMHDRNAKRHKLHIEQCALRIANNICIYINRFASLFPVLLPRSACVSCLPSSFLLLFQDDKGFYLFVWSVYINLMLIKIAGDSLVHQIKCPPNQHYRSFAIEMAIMKWKSDKYFYTEFVPFYVCWLHIWRYGCVSLLFARWTKHYFYRRCWDSLFICFDL